jgi:hypothetical protein
MSIPENRDFYSLLVLKITNKKQSTEVKNLYLDEMVFLYSKKRVKPLITL